MQEPYRYEILPLDTPDDDPRWARYLDIFDLGFLSKRADEKQVAVYRDSRRADQSMLGMVTTEGHGLDGRVPVAAFTSSAATVNTGAGCHPLQIVQTVVVRASHRRRGLLKEMMAEQLRAARDSGKALAALSASEATIYERFGFGPATRSSRIEVETRRFALRDDVPRATGTLEFVDPKFLADHYDRISSEHQVAYRGAVSRLHGHRLLHTGAWDREEGAPSRNLRAIVHFDDAGTADGFALFTHKGWDTNPVTTDVGLVCAPEPAVERALWEALSSIDLVERLTSEYSHPGDALPLALVDQRAVKTTETGDQVWLRVLDLPAAVAQRGFERDGDVIVGVSDRLGHCEGTWRISVADGVGSAEQVAGEPEVTLDVAQLAPLWFGDRTAALLAQAGLITGTPDAIRRLSELFATALPPVNLSMF